MFQRKNTLIVSSVFLLIFIALFFVSGYSELQSAEVAFREKKFSVAAQFYEKVAPKFFWQNDLWEKAGISAAQAGQYEQAIFYFQKSKKLSEQGWAWFGTSYFELGEVEKSISTFESGLQNFQSATLYRLLASVQRSEKNWGAEKIALENQIKLDSNDAYAHYRFGLLLTLFNSDLAYAELQNASTLNVEVDSATQTLISALNVADTQSSESEKKITIGRALGLVQEWDLALVAFEQAIQLDSQNAEAWAWLGEAKQQLGQDGSVELNQAVRLNHTSATVRGLRALYWSRQGKYAQVLAEYSLANEFEPTNPAWLAGIGEAHTQLGDLISALAAYQQATELAPNDATYWRLLAMFCVENDIYIEEIAVPAAQQAFSLSPNDVMVLDTLGLVYFSSRRYASAEQTLLQAIKLSPQYFPAHLHLALNYLAQNNRTAAYNSLTYVRDADVSGVYRATAQQLLNQYFP
jgi:tetratricopeptide (TPR) repeat protein